MIQYTGEEAELESSGVPEERANMSLCLFSPGFLESVISCNVSWLFLCYFSFLMLSILCVRSGNVSFHSTPFHCVPAWLRRKSSDLLHNLIFAEVRLSVCHLEYLRGPSDVLLAGKGGTVTETHNYLAARVVCAPTLASQLRDVETIAYYWHTGSFHSYFSDQFLEDY